jgi:hypothetical protein
VDETVLVLEELWQVALNRIMHAVSTRNDSCVPSFVWIGHDEYLDDADDEEVEQEEELEREQTKETEKEKEHESDEEQRGGLEEEVPEKLIKKHSAPDLGATGRRLRSKSRKGGLKGRRSGGRNFEKGKGKKRTSAGKRRSNRRRHAQRHQHRFIAVPRLKLLPYRSGCQLAEGSNDALALPDPLTTLSVLGRMRKRQFRGLFRLPRCETPEFGALR